VATSGTYTFASIDNTQLIEDAYERIGLSPSIVPLTAYQLQTARRSINLLLSEWMNRGLNLWTVSQQLLTLVPNQSTYSLPIEVIDILEASVRQSVRELNGTAFASSGIATNAFDGNSATACIQNAPNGNIGYDYGAEVQQTILMLGVQSNITTIYTLSFQVSNDNVNWSTVLTIPAQTYTVGLNIWFEITTPATARYYRVLETGGATLNIQELYFNDTVNDLFMTPQSRYEYMSIPNKYSLIGLPLTYTVNRLENPQLILWPPPSAQYNCIVYNCKRKIQDVGSAINTLDIPQRFYEALCAGTALKLAFKFPKIAADKIPALKEEYKESFALASQEDTEKYIPFNIELNFTGT
jgi:hypothetical protein